MEKSELNVYFVVLWIELGGDYKYTQLWFYCKYIFKVNFKKIGKGTWKNGNSDTQRIAGLNGHRD